MLNIAFNLTWFTPESLHYLFLHKNGNEGKNINYKKHLLSIVCFSWLSIRNFYWTYRYHYNVADARLRQHVDKGNEDGLYISCVASSANLWALIMDAGTGFTSQVYELSAVFLHKVVVWI